MLLSYVTSSISYDTVDLIHGKFVPAMPPSMIPCDPRTCSQYNPPVRFFINIYGVFANLTGRFAERYDDLQLPMMKDTDGVLNPEYIKTEIPKSGVEAIMEEDGFWPYVQPYPWSMLIMGEMYKLARGQYYFLLPMYDCRELEDRLVWVNRHFGMTGRNRSMLLNCESACLLIKSRNDIFIGSDLYNCECWSRAGGSAFWWPELSPSAKEPAKTLNKRIKLLTQAVNDLYALSAKTK